jgi:hypothetical protein
MAHYVNTRDKQLKTKVAQWRLEKNIKKHEMAAIVRKQQQRKATDNKDSAFRVRGREVEASKINRFVRTQEIKGANISSIASPAACQSTLLILSSTSLIGAHSDAICYQLLHTPHLGSIITQRGS